MVAGLRSGARQSRVAGTRGALEAQVGVEVAIGAQEREHAFLVVGGKFLVERAGAHRLAEQFGDGAAHVVVRLAHLDRLAAIGGGVVEQRPAVGVDLDLHGDAELAAIAEHRLVCARNPRRSGIEVEVLVECA